jgi:hypothetical protein
MSEPAQISGPSAVERQRTAHEQRAGDCCVGNYLLVNCFSVNVYIFLFLTCRWEAGGILFSDHRGDRWRQFIRCRAQGYPATLAKPARRSRRRSVGFRFLR